MTHYQAVLLITIKNPITSAAVEGIEESLRQILNAHEVNFHIFSQATGNEITFSNERNDTKEDNWEPKSGNIPNV